MKNKVEKFDTETIEAIEGSIRKWEKIVAGEDSDRGSNNCPLCYKFAIGKPVHYCKKCPVFLNTGERNCDGTPYILWTEYYWLAGPNDMYDIKGDKVFDEESKRLAQAEVDFLKSLLPKE